MGLGAQYDNRVYQMFACSILMFYLQFYSPSEELMEAESAALRKVFQGPGNWISHNLLKAMRSQLGSPFEVPVIDTVSLASRMRLLLSEPFLHSSNKQKIVEEARRGCRWDDHGLRHEWADGYSDYLLH